MARVYMPCEDSEVWSYDVQTEIEEDSGVGTKMVFFDDHVVIADAYCYIDLDEDEVDHFESHYGAFPDDFEDRIVVVVF